MPTTQLDLATLPREAETLRPLTLPNPKPNGYRITGRASWYPYYAGYSPAFVRKVLTEAGLPNSAVVLDSWNGAGTTTQIAHDLGYNSIGFDLNPAMTLVAAARASNPAQFAELEETISEILESVDCCRSGSDYSDDPLAIWFSLPTIAGIRSLESAIKQLGGQPGVYTSEPDYRRAFLYTVLFRSVRRLLTPFRASNPTWIKQPKDPSFRLSFTVERITEVFRSEAGSMIAAISEESRSYDRQGNARLRLETASSTSLPLEADAADIIIASPPYCTRIDYAVSTSIELAVLGHHPLRDLRELRHQMIGTSTIRPSMPEPDPAWGLASLDLLAKISAHHSKDSKSYYWKTHVQYLADIFKSLKEIARCLKPGGACVLVVQDSYYKDVHNDLANIFTEMASSAELGLLSRHDFTVSRSLAEINIKARHHRATRPLTESVLWFGNEKVIEVEYDTQHSRI